MRRRPERGVARCWETKTRDNQLVTAVLLVPEEEDISLEERARRVNRITCLYKAARQHLPGLPGIRRRQKYIISLHVDGIIDFINQRANEPL